MILRFADCTLDTGRQSLSHLPFYGHLTWETFHAALLRFLGR